jgi:hypothetical protein
MTRWARLWRRMTRMFDVDAVPVTVVDDMAPDPHGWSAGYADTAGTGYRTVARRLPLLIATSLRLAAEASKPRTVALLAVQTASSLAGAFSRCPRGGRGADVRRRGRSEPRDGRACRRPGAGCSAVGARAGGRGSDRHRRRLDPRVARHSPGIP